LVKLAPTVIIAILAIAAPGNTASDAGSCSAECDRKAADCVDFCEAQHKDAKTRVECKLSCITAREKCEKDCK
jgi:hypothetical protein